MWWTRSTLPLTQSCYISLCLKLLAPSKNISCKKNNREAIELHNTVANKFQDNLTATKYQEIFQGMALMFWLIEE